MDMEQRAKHNALLKQLLSKEQAFRGEAHPPSTPDVSLRHTAHHASHISTRTLLTALILSHTTSPC